MEDIDLSEYDNDFEAAEAQDRGGVPDGKYQVAVDVVELKLTKQKRIPMLCWTFIVLVGTYARRKIYRNDLIQADKMSRLKTDLYTCGLKITKLSELKANLDKLLDLKLEIQQKTKAIEGRDEPYVNVYINKRITTEDQAASAGGTF